jgi:hypothetical protein
MSIQGVIFVDGLGLGLMLLILNLIRTKKLHVGYGAIWFLAVSVLMTMVSVPPLLTFLPKMMGAVYPASALSLLAFFFIFVVLIFFSVQLSILSSRQVELIQALALQELLNQESRGKSDHSA